MKNRLENIFLLRHGDSEGNEDISKYREKPDATINLIPRGKKRCEDAGAWFKNYINAGNVKIEPGMIRMWHSPYARTKESCYEFLKGFGMPGFFRDVREDILLTEQQFGAFDGLTDDECAAAFPEEWQKHKLSQEYSVRLYSRPPNGESRFDVCLRTRQFFGTIIRDAEKEENNMPNVFISSHGTTIRAFTMMWLHLSTEWFEKEPNPKNASIRHIGRDRNGRWKDYGYIYDGRAGGGR